MTVYYLDSALGSDANAGTAEGAGNAWQTWGKALSTAAAGDTVHVKSSAAYTLTASPTCANSGSIAAGPIQIIGYQTTPGDGGTKPTVTSATNSIRLVDLNGKSYWNFDNIRFTHTAATRGYGISASASVSASTGLVVRNCEFDGCLVGIDGDNVTNFQISKALIHNCKIVNSTAQGIRIGGMGAQFASKIIDTMIAGNAGAGLLSDNNNAAFFLEGCIIYDNGAEGVAMTATPTQQNLWLRRCAIHSNTGNGVTFRSAASGELSHLEIENCYFWSNGGYGISITGGGASVCQIGVNRNNAYGSNTSGARNSLPVGTADLTLTGDPATNAAGGDFSLNNTAGAGAALRNAGFPGVLTGGGTGYADIGPLRHQDAAAGGTGSIFSTPIIRGAA